VKVSAAKKEREKNLAPLILQPSLRMRRRERGGHTYHVGQQNWQVLLLLSKLIAFRPSEGGDGIDINIPIVKELNEHKGTPTNCC